MSDDEGGVVVLSLLAAFLGWAFWITPILTQTPPLRPTAAGVRRLLLLSPLALFIALLVVLRLGASHDVRDDARYLLMYSVMGMGWVGLLSHFTPLLGVSLKDDALHGGNSAVGLVLVGAQSGLLGCFVGGNIGDGPGWWIVVGCAAWATIVWFGCWVILEKVTHLSEVVGIDRDPATAVRFAALLAALGISLGVSVAGDWHSAAGAMRDFAWRLPGSLGILAFGCISEPYLQPSADDPRPGWISAGLLPAAVVLGFAASFAAYVLGWS